jgi:rRNA maturation endonuclease Nob1
MSVIPSWTLPPGAALPESSEIDCTHFWQDAEGDGHRCGWCGERRTIADTVKHFHALYDQLHRLLDSAGVTTGGLPTERVAAVLEAWEADRAALRDARIQMVALRAERDAVREAAKAAEWRGWCDDCRRMTTQEIGRACPDCGLRTTPWEE